MTTETDQIANKVPEAARRLGISHTTLYKHINDGSLIAHRLCGRTVILESELLAFAMREAKPLREGV